MENGSAAELRVLVVAPTGRDDAVICEVLAADGIAGVACADLAELARELERGAGAILLTTEALATPGLASLERVLDAQEPWSNLSVILASEHGRAMAPERFIGASRRAGALTVLERPMRVLTLQTVAQAALRTRRRQYELRGALEQLRRNVERLDSERVIRERFVSVLAHDLRGPLSAAATTVQVLLQLPDPGPQCPDLARRLERNLQRMERMIRDLLDANRIRAGEPWPVDLERCDLMEIVADAMADLDEAARSRVHRRGPDLLEGTWAPDPLRRAVWNLLVNALKYGLAGTPVDLSVSTAGEEVVIAVHNDGPPIPAEEQQRIFEPFGRARTETQARGWGLGLTLVRGCAEAHGGSVTLTSTAGSGTTFAMRLPRDALAARGRPFPPGARDR